MFWEEQAACLGHLPETWRSEKLLCCRAWLLSPEQQHVLGTPHPRAQPLPAPTGATQVIASPERGWAWSTTQALCVVCMAGWCLSNGLSMLEKEILVWFVSVFQKRVFMCVSRGEGQWCRSWESQGLACHSEKAFLGNLDVTQHLCTPILYLWNENRSCLDSEVCWKDTKEQLWSVWMPQLGRKGSTEPHLMRDLRFLYSHKHEASFVPFFISWSPD